MLSAWQLIEANRVNASLSMRIRELEGRNMALLATLQVTSTPTPTPTDTATPTATATNISTPTVTPTFTPIPTYTPYPTPTMGPDPETEFLLGADLMCQYANYVFGKITSGAWILGDCHKLILNVREGDWYHNNDVRKTATPKPTLPSDTPEPSSYGLES